jgi:RNA polymerase sigma factor for flagellar operon FliA
MSPTRVQASGLKGRTGSVNMTRALEKPAEPRHYPHTAEDLRKEPDYPIWLRLHSGDRSARDELVLRYAPVVKHVIGRMAIRLPFLMDPDDVLSAGTIGLLQAIDRFDPDQGVRFQTYAQQRIRGAIVDAIRSHSPLSRGASRRARWLDETTAVMEQQLGRAPRREELAQELGVDLEQLGRMELEAAHTLLSLDDPYFGLDGEVQSLGDLLRAPDEPAEENEQVERLRVVIESLPPRERLVLDLYYHDELTLKEISRVIGVSESRVSQIHIATLKKLRAELLLTDQLAMAA